MTERETTRTNDGGDATAGPDETELTWLAAGWVGLKELEGSPSAGLHRRMARPGASRTPGTPRRRDLLRRDVA